MRLVGVLVLFCSSSCDPALTPLLLLKEEITRSGGWGELNSHPTGCTGEDRETEATDGGIQESRTFYASSWPWAQEGYWSLHLVLCVRVIFFIPFPFGRKGEEPYSRKSPNHLPRWNGRAFPPSGLQLATQHSEGFGAGSDVGDHGRNPTDLFCSFLDCVSYPAILLGCRSRNT